MRPFNRLILLTAFTVLIALLANAQGIYGNWQGTIKAGPQEIRLIVTIDQDSVGGWKGTLFSIDQTPDRGIGTPVNSITLSGSKLKFSIDLARATYEGEVSTDGNSVKGVWTQGGSLPLAFQRATPANAWKDPSPHNVQRVTVDKEVNLEVLDWGGSGRPLVLLAGLGNTAHVFDKFAPKLSASYHVYGITRRGFGASSAPLPSADAIYSADRLGDDVLAVIDALKLNRPVLVGHSLGGEELSSVGSRHPERVAGLIYLDAGYAYAYYDRSRGDLGIDLIDLLKKLEQLQPGRGPQDPRHLIEELLAATLPGFERDLKEMQKNLTEAPPALPTPALPPISQAIMAGMQKYTDIRVPALAIYAVPHATGQPYKDDAARVTAEARDEANTGAQAKALESGVPSVRVVRLPHANHYVFFSNEADVLHEMNAFISSLPQQN